VNGEASVSVAADEFVTASGNEVVADELARSEEKSLEVADVVEGLAIEDPPATAGGAHGGTIANEELGVSTGKRPEKSGSAIANEELGDSGEAPPARFPPMASPASSTGVT